MDAAGPLGAGKLALHDILDKQLLAAPLALAQALQRIHGGTQLLALGGRPARLRAQQRQQPPRRQPQLRRREPHVRREQPRPLAVSARPLVRHVVVVVVGVGARRRTRARRRRVRCAARRAGRWSAGCRGAGRVVGAGRAVRGREPLQREAQALGFVLRVRAVVLGHGVGGPQRFGFVHRPHVLG